MNSSKLSKPYLPLPVLSKIASYAGQDGVEGLRSWIVAGPEGKDAALSEETLLCLHLDKTDDFPWWSDPLSWHYNLFRKCLRLHNPSALYVDALRLAFNVGEIDAALYILNDVKAVYPHAELMFIMLNFCGGYDCDSVYQKFRGRYKYPQVSQMGLDLLYHIRAVQPRKLNTFAKTWKCEECVWAENISKEYQNELCIHCVYFYMSLDICKLS